MNIEMLELLYDKVSELDDTRCVVLGQGELKIIDQEANVLFEKTNVKNYEAGILNRLYIQPFSAGYIECYRLDTLSKVKSERCLNVERISQHGYIIEDASGDKKIVNDKGKTILGPISASIKLYRSTSTADWLRVHPFGENLNENYTWSEIRVDKEYNETDGLFAMGTQIPGLDIVIVNSRHLRYRYQGNRKVRLRNNGVIVSKEYSNILPRRALINHGIIQVYDDITVSKTLTGYIDFEGKEIVPPIYNSVEYIGNGIVVVKDDNGYGTVVNGREVIKTGKINECHITNNIPMSATIVDGVQYFIGNDGHAYSEVTKAFPIYISTILTNVYLMCLYGSWIYVDSNFNRIDEQKIPRNAMNKNLWQKV